MSLGGLGWPRTGEGFGSSLRRSRGSVAVDRRRRHLHGVADDECTARQRGGVERRTGGSRSGSVRRLFGVPRLSARRTTTMTWTSILRPARAGRSPSRWQVPSTSAAEGRRWERPVSLPNAPNPPPPSTYWLGDSYVAGGASTYPGFDDLAHVASTRAGLTDVTVDALGAPDTCDQRSGPFPGIPHAGTPQPRRSPGPTAADRRRRLDQRCRVRRDAGQRAAAALYGYLRRAVPQARVVVVTFASATPRPEPKLQPIRESWAAARAAPNVVGVLDLPARIGCARRRRRGRAPIGRAGEPGHPGPPLRSGPPASTGGSSGHSRELSEQAEEQRSNPRGMRPGPARLSRAVRGQGGSP